MAGGLPIRPRMPSRNPVIDEDGLITRQWRLFLRGQGDTLDVAPVRAGLSVVNSSDASISATPVPMTVNAGLYRVSVFARRLISATTSSELQVTIGFTQGTVSLSVETVNDTNNTITQAISGSWLIRVDATTTITYETTYVSVGATAMTYRLDVTVEQVQV